MGSSLPNASVGESVIIYCAGAAGALASTIRRADAPDTYQQLHVTHGGEEGGQVMPRWPGLQPPPAMKSSDCRYDYRYPASVYSQGIL